jgi:excisionase family DNA binding protein
MNHQAQHTSGGRLLTPREVEGVLGLSESSVYRLIKSGQLPIIRIGHSVRVAPGDLARFIGNRREVAA